MGAGCGAVHVPAVGSRRNAHFRLKPIPAIAAVHSSEYRNDVGLQSPPHFYAYYQSAAAVFAIQPVECIGGSLPRTQQRLVEAWAEIHQAVCALQDLRTFNAVILDPEVGTLVWPNGADFAPATLHDWPLLHADLMRMARGWADRSHAGHQAG
ncbi:MAG: DUF4160 domain-containing protein [Acidobacteria bacterium]|nr:DUF4160 domain-containing protein [Acidobacteriota bacterium]